MLILHSLPDALLVCFSSRTDVLHCLVSHWRWVTLKDLTEQQTKGRAGTGEEVGPRGQSVPFGCAKLSAHSAAAATALSHTQDQHIWTLPKSYCTPSVSCGAFWYCLFLYPRDIKMYQSGVSWDQREKNMCCPSGMKWDILQGPFLVLMQSFIIISTSEGKESEYCF